ncbi:MAG: hypothetical protein QOF94_1197 [Acidobacteriaceae bacterium]
MLRHLLLAALVFELSGTVSAAELKPATVAAFDHYVQLSEQRMATEMPGTFLLIDSLPAEQRDAGYIRLRAGEVITDRLDTVENGKPIPVPSGLIHHWRGLSFVKGTTLKKTLAFLQDYDHQDKYYAPDVQRSKLLLHNGDDFKIFLRLRKHKVVTVILDTEYDVKYTTLDRSHSISTARSTRIAEVESADQPDGAEKPVGNDSGYLWRLYSYWRFYERDGGVYIQLEAISLTRGIPAGFGWLVRPFITSIPQESLTFTLTHTRDALQKP